MDDKEAVRHVTRDVLKRFWLIPLLCLAPMLSALRGDFGEGSGFNLWAVAGSIFILVFDFSSRSVRMLPVSRKMLAKSLWQFTVGFPVVIMAELSAINALCRSLTEDSWREAWGRAACSFSYFLLFDGALVMGVALGFMLGRKHSKYDVILGKGWSVGLKAIRVMLLFIVTLFVVWAVIIPHFEDVPQTGQVNINLIAGSVVFVVTYLLRNKLILEQQDLESVKAWIAEPNMVLPTPGRDPWKIALLKHMSGTILWSAFCGFATISACMIVMNYSREHPLQADVFLGIIAFAAVLNIYFAWARWIGELRAWRMLPFSRAQLGVAVVGFIATASVLPWALAFVVTGLVFAPQECLKYNEQFSLLGVSVAIQGVLFAVLPSLLRGLDDTLRKVLPTVTLLIGIGCALFSVLLLTKFDVLTHGDLRTHGWAWMATGILVLCAGMALSTWHTSRVLRHGDCYRRTTE